MHKSKHIVLVAGEESGDLHAAKLIKQLKAQDPFIRISGIGGQHMQAAGASLIADLAGYGVTGVTEVLRFIGILYQAFLAIKKHLKNERPDLLILVDYPGFNLRLAQYAKKKLGLRILYYISPQIWAWKAKRLHLIKECIDHMAVILPFEKKIYEQAAVPVTYVGHPLVEKLGESTAQEAKKIELKLPEQKKIIVLLPGSRSNEIEKHMPVLQDTARLLAAQGLEAHFVLPLAQNIETKKIKAYSFEPLSISIIEGKAIDCMIAADFIIVASGTASLEAALLQKPMCIIYKSSFFTYILAVALIKVKFLGLCNLLANKMIVPEFLQYDCNASELARYSAHLLQNNKLKQKMRVQLAEIKEALSLRQADCTLFELVQRELNAKSTS